MFVNMNGEIGPYFKSYKELRQGDLTSIHSKVTQDNSMPLKKINVKTMVSTFFIY